tara:strand:+ start:938 stop:1129 length:192 start_codon:yes stop_codon:yes gene_type:complete
MVSMDKIIEHSVNFGLFFSTMGLLGELTNKKKSLSKCLVTNGYIGLSLLLIGNSVKIYKSVKG